MKQGRETKNKQRESAARKTAKPVCGTLSYLAECRGTLQKSGSGRWTAPPHGMRNIDKK